MSALSMMPKVVEVLRWYANRETYRYDDSSFSLSAAELDKGERARAILAELERERTA